MTTTEKVSHGMDGKKYSAVVSELWCLLHVWLWQIWTKELLRICFPWAKTGTLVYLVCQNFFSVAFKSSQDASCVHMFAALGKRLVDRLWHVMMFLYQKKLGVCLCVWQVVTVSSVSSQPITVSCFLPPTVATRQRSVLSFSLLRFWHIHYLLA